LCLDINYAHYTDYLHDSIEKLELSYGFNLELSNLPSSIKKIIFNKKSYHNKELNCLPNGLEIIGSQAKYKHQIQNMHPKLKKLICSKDYSFINNFSGIEVKIY